VGFLAATAIDIGVGRRQTTVFASLAFEVPEADCPYDSPLRRLSAAHAAFTYTVMPSPLSGPKRTTPTKDFAMGFTTGMGSAVGIAAFAARFIKPGTLVLGTNAHRTALAVCATMSIPYVLLTSVAGKQFKAKNVPLFVRGSIAGLGAGTSALIIFLPSAFGDASLLERVAVTAAAYLSGIAVTMLWAVSCALVSTYAVFDDPALGGAIADV
jgi:hypothetical protein